MYFSSARPVGAGTCNTAGIVRQSVTFSGRVLDSSKRMKIHYPDFSASLAASYFNKTIHTIGTIADRNRGQETL